MKRLDDLVARCEAAAPDGRSGDDRLLADLRQAARLAGGLEPYLLACTSPESPALHALAERTAAERWPADSPLEQEMLSGHLEGQVLKSLVHATRARQVLEIGTFTGYATLAMAEELPDGGRVVACEIDGDVARLARECWDASPAGDRIDLRVAPATDTLADLAEAGEVFDLVFIDADKGGYVDYLMAILDGHLLAPHGLVCVDNTLMQGEPYAGGELSANGEAIAVFNQRVVADRRVAQVVLPVRDGITLIRRVDGR